MSSSDRAVYGLQGALGGGQVFGNAADVRSSVHDYMNVVNTREIRKTPRHLPLSLVVGYESSIPVNHESAVLSRQ